MTAQRLTAWTKCRIFCVDVGGIRHCLRNFVYEGFAKAPAETVHSDFHGTFGQSSARRVPVWHLGGVAREKALELVEEVASGVVETRRPGGSRSITIR